MSGQIEEWKDIKFNPNYELSSLGRIRNKLTNKFLKPTTDRSGYYRVCLCDGKDSRKVIFMHRVMGELFIPNDDPANKKMVIYKDSTKKHDFSISNLMWASHQYMMDKCLADGRIDPSKIGRAGALASKAKISKPVRLIYEDGTLIGDYSSQADCAKALGIPATTFTRVVKGQLELVM